MNVNKWGPGMLCDTCKSERCHCVRCGKCRKNVPPRLFCARCLYCREHHTIYAPKDFPIRGCTYWDEFDKTTYVDNPLKRFVGVELEYTNFGSFRRDGSLKHLSYQLVHDGSVQGSGLELVTHKAAGDHLLVGLCEMAAVLKAHRVECNQTCGFHVHVDAGDFSPLDLRRALAGFKLIQMNLYGTLVDMNRLSDWGKMYSAPLAVDLPGLMSLGTKTDVVNFFHKWLYGTDAPRREGMSDYEWKLTLRELDANLKRLKATKYVNQARRWALNFHSWMMRGTLEFRLKEGTTNPEDIIMWPLWCGWFIESMKHLDDKEVLYWMKSPPTVLDMSNHMHTSGMPVYVLDWVKGKVTK